VELAHYVFAPIFCAPCIAIFVSAIFEDKKITGTIFRLSLFSLSLASILAALELRKGDRQLLLDLLVALVITICTYLVTRFLADFESEQTRSILSSYKKQFELTEQLKRDHLTGLFNRKALFELLDHYIDKRPQNGIYLAVIDIDDYKNVNDKYGHIQGDTVLKCLAAILEKHVLQYGFIARFGGDEFAIVFIDIPVAQACGIIDKVRKEFNSHRFDFQKDHPVTFTCGLASHRGQTSQEFFETADKALYQAKAQGKNCTVCEETVGIYN
jgi:diguanylate cyclase (GGDEF)-like protein